MNEKKYCYKCGAELRAVETGYYDSQTGSKSTKHVCPSGLCEHEGVTHDMTRAKGIIASLFCGWSDRCKKCDYKYQAIWSSYD